MTQSPVQTQPRGPRSDSEFLAALQRSGAFVHESLSAIKIETGKPVDFNTYFKQASTEPFTAYYNPNNNNPFDSGKGIVAGVEVEVWGPNGDPFDPAAGTAPYDRWKEFMKLRQFLRYEQTVGSDNAYKGTGKQLMAPLPFPYRAIRLNAGTTADAMQSVAPADEPWQRQDVLGTQIARRTNIAYDAGHSMTCRLYAPSFVVGQLADHYLVLRHVWVQRRQAGNQAPE